MFYEYSSTGTPSFDSSNSTVNGNASANPQSGAAPAVNGTNELIVQGGYADAGISINSVNTGYTLFQVAGALSRGTASLVNTTVNTTPSFTLSSSARFTAGVISIHDNVGVVTYVTNVSVIVVGP